jgi:hypothetical protein
MSFATNFLLGLVFAFVGAVLSWLLTEPHRIPRWIALNHRTNWKGVWYCAWYPRLPGDLSWVIDKVRFSHRLGKLKVDVEESTEGYLWEATLSIKDQYVIGEWRSLKPNTHSRGTLQLMVSNQGDSLFGLSTGPHIDGHLTTFRFVFAERESEVRRIMDGFKKHL